MVSLCSQLAPIYVDVSPPDGALLGQKMVRRKTAQALHLQNVTTFATSIFKQALSSNNN